jgi:hypothetical protein
VPPPHAVRPKRERRRAVCPGRRSRNRLSPIADNGRLIIDRNFTVADEPAIGAILGGDFI